MYIMPLKLKLKFMADNLQYAFSGPNFISEARVAGHINKERRRDERAAKKAEKEAKKAAKKNASTPDNNVPDTIREKIDEMTDKGIIIDMEAKPAAEETKPEEPKKTEEQIKAEAEAPVEEAGAEKLPEVASSEKKIEVFEPDVPQQEVAMSSIPRIEEETTAGNINMADIGVNFNLNEVDKAMNTPQPVVPQPAVVDNAVYPNPMMPVNPNAVARKAYEDAMRLQAMMQQQQCAGMQPVGFQQPNQPPMFIPPNGGFMMPDQMIQYAAAQQQQIHTNIGNEELMKNTSPSVVVTEPVIDIPDMVIEGEGKQAKIQPGILQKNMPKVENPKAEPFVSRFDNSEAIALYPVMGEIEALANSCNVDIAMSVIRDNLKNPIGFIDCNSHVNGIPVAQKHFIVDMGNIIDFRVKMFPDQQYSGIANIENLTPYFVYQENRNDKQKKRLNVDMFKSYFLGGEMNITDKPAYSKKYMDLHKVLDLRTLNTKGMRTEDRKFIQNLMVEHLENGFFTKWQRVNPNIRFGFIKAITQKNRTVTIGTFQMRQYRFNPACVPDPMVIEVDFNPDGTKTIRCPFNTPGVEAQFGTECSVKPIQTKEASQS